MDKPELTIGISFYNTSSTLIDLLKSIYSQTFTKWELILIDDGSTDNPLEILNKVNDDRVTVISDGYNKGMAKRYNEITKIAKGKYIARFDADDICDPTRFEKQVDFLNNNPSIDVVSSDMYTLDQNDNLKGLCHIPDNHAGIFCDPIKGVWFHHGPMMGRKEWFERFPYNEKYKVAVDYALYISSYAKSKFASISEPLYYYRVYETHSFRKYYRTTISNIDIIKEYYPADVSSFKKNMEISKRYLRIGIYLIAEIIGLNDYLISKRDFNTISLGKKKTCESLIEQIKKSKIPGIDK